MAYKKHLKAALRNGALLIASGMIMVALLKANEKI